MSTTQTFRRVSGVSGLIATLLLVAGCQNGPPIRCKHVPGLPTATDIIKDIKNGDSPLQDAAKKIGELFGHKQRNKTRSTEPDSEVPVNLPPC